MTSVNFNSPLLKDSLHDKVLKFQNCKIFYGNCKGLYDSELWVLNGKVVDARKIFYDLKRTADLIIDCDGLIISPGFIDIQVNGAFGIDFSSASLSTSDIDVITKGLLQYGVTAFCPTIISSTTEVYKSVLAKIADCMKSSNNLSTHAAILGTHLEGPFISHDKCGCHPTGNIISSFTDNSSSSTDEAKEENVKRKLEQVYGNIDSKVVALITVAPELPGALQAISYLTKEKNICVSIGHSKASFEVGNAAINVGATCITHLFNAQSSFHHRKTGFLGLLTREEKTHPLYYGIIADGIHVSREALRLAYRLNFSGLILVTDCISALGLDDGIFQLGDVVVEVKQMTATIKGSHVVAGSVAAMPYCVSVLMESTGCELDEALQCATWKPACFLGIENERGSLQCGHRADFSLLSRSDNGNIHVEAVFVGGTRLFENQ